MLCAIADATACGFDPALTRRICSSGCSVMCSFSVRIVVPRRNNYEGIEPRCKSKNQQELGRWPKLRKAHTPYPAYKGIFHRFQTWLLRSTKMTRKRTHAEGLVCLLNQASHLAFNSSNNLRLVSISASINAISSSDILSLFS